MVLIAVMPLISEQQRDQAQDCIRLYTTHNQRVELNAIAR